MGHESPLQRNDVPSVQKWKIPSKPVFVSTISRLVKSLISTSPSVQPDSNFFVPPENNGEGEGPNPSAIKTTSAPSETATATKSASSESSTTISSISAEEGGTEKGATSTSFSATAGEETTEAPQNAVIAPEVEAEPTTPASANVNNDIRVHGPMQVEARRRSNSRGIAFSLLARSVFRVSRRGSRQYNVLKFQGSLFWSSVA
ncbi:hypothetical protein FRB91_000880 [Serendipita sp. 411]|nr:hypothetical protein FRC18_000855 [Serendipita sp. 400]KAG8846366.1 hypothetical protein FRB91_000880 [Serendipita sp. 411]